MPNHFLFTARLQSQLEQAELTPVHSWAVVKLILLAANAPIPGVIPGCSGSQLELADADSMIASKVGLDVSEWVSVRKHLTHIEFLVEGPEGLQIRQGIWAEIAPRGPRPISDLRHRYATRDLVPEVVTASPHPSGDRPVLPELPPFPRVQLMQPIDSLAEERLSQPLEVIAEELAGPYPLDMLHWPQVSVLITRRGSSAFAVWVTVFNVLACDLYGYINRENLTTYVMQAFRFDQRAIDQILEEIVDLKLLHPVLWKMGCAFSPHVARYRGEDTKQLTASATEEYEQARTLTGGAV